MLNRLFLTTALTTLALSLSGLASAQLTIDSNRDTPADTATNGDITINSGVTVTTTTAGPAITLNSDNSVNNQGAININDVDGATAVEIQGGNTGSYTQSGSISLLEDYTPKDTDGDRIPDETLASGTGRTGVLISGASPFVGNVSFANTSSVAIEGNDSYGIRLADTAGLTGNLTALGTIAITGDNSYGISLENQIIGELALGGRIETRGTNTTAVNVAGDIDGGFTSSARISNTGYRFTDRPNITGRGLIDENDLNQGGAAVSISGNVSGGILFDQVETTTTNDAGVESTSVTAIATVTQFGSAPAILIDGQGTPIAIGRVSTVTDPDADGYNAGLLYAFVNEGTLTGSGIYDDMNSRTFEVRDAVLDGGISNTGTMTAASFRSGDNGTADVDGFTGTAQVIIIGNGAIADRINNSGVIAARVSEADDTIYADRGAVQGVRPVTAIAIDIEAGGSLTSITNTGSIASVVTARTGEVIAIRDRSGTLRTVTNTGTISAFGLSSDAESEAVTNFTTVALDLSNNTSGVTLTQSLAVDLDTTDTATPTPPSINGDILLGSGDDVVAVNSGFITGDISFGGGDDSLSLSGATYRGALSNSSGGLMISAIDSSLTNSSATPVSITSASFDGTSSYNPTLNGATGQASTLVASGNISFADGAQINPTLSNIIGTTNNTFTIASASDLSIGGNLAALNGAVSPFLYNTTYSIDPNNSNSLIVTLDLRETSELGLDNAQTAAFTSAFEALGANAGLGNAFVNITDGTAFNQAFNQLMPEFAAAARQFVIANVDGATGAVGAHLDNVRRSQDRPGGAWIQEFAYFADRDLAGLSEQYRGSGFGFNAGFDSAIGPFHAVGITAGFASTQIESVSDLDDPLDVLTIQLGTYAGYEIGDLGFEAYAGVGYNDFESERKINVGDFTGSADGDWTGTHYNASLRAGYDMEFGDKFFVRPSVSLDYLSLSEKAYTESGDTGIALDIDSRSSESGSATAMLNFGARFMGKRTWIRPSLRVGLRNDFINDGVFTTGRFVGGTTPFNIQSEAFPDSGFLLGLSVAAGSEFSSFSLDIDSDIRDGFVRHTGRIVLRLLF